MNLFILLGFKFSVGDQCMTDNGRKALIFLHIPKTAGITLSRIIEKQYNAASIFSIDGANSAASIEKFKQLPESRREKIQVLQGHMPFGLHAFLPQGALYITLLREPVDRVISAYYYICGFAGHPLHKVVSPMSLEEFVSKTIDNQPTRLLAGQTMADVAFGQCSSEMLETAKTNLREHFSVIGLTERFDETLILLKRYLGWKEITVYSHQNMTVARPPKSAIPKSAIRLIEEHSQLDIALYQYAKELYEERMQKEWLSFKRDLILFNLHRTLGKQRKELAKRLVKSYRRTVPWPIQKAVYSLWARRHL